jgi:hypothetical protein
MSTDFKRKATMKTESGRSRSNFNKQNAKHSLYKTFVMSILADKKDFRDLKIMRQQWADNRYKPLCLTIF